MPSTPAGRSLQTLELPAGPAGVAMLFTALSQRLLADGPPIALVSAGGSQTVAETQRRAVTPTPETRLPEDLAVICPTSGSTGAPRGVLLTEANLRAAARMSDAALNGPAAWFIALNPAAAGALAAITRCVLGDTALGAWSALGAGAPFDPVGLLDELAGFVGASETAGLPVRTSLVSTQLARLLALEGAAEVLSRFDRILLGGGAIHPSLLGRYRAAGLPVVRTYGMTETTGGCVYDGRPLGGTRLAIVDEEIVVSGPTVAAGYCGSPSGGAAHFEGRRLYTGDRGDLVGGQLVVGGRLDDVVAVRGANVDRGAVERLLASVPGVLEAAVAAIPDESHGARLIAFVVGRADPAILRAAVADGLGSAAVPTVVTVPDLPRLSGGKVDLPSLMAEASQQPEGR